MEPEVSRRLEILENGLKELKDLYLSIKIEFMEVKNNANDGTVPESSTSTQDIPISAPPTDIEPLRKQIESMQQQILHLQDQSKTLKSQVPEPTPTPEGRIPRKMKDIVVKNQKDVIAMSMEMSKYRKELENIIKELESKGKVDTSGLSKELMDKKLAELEERLSNKVSSKGGGRGPGKVDIDNLKARMESLEHMVDNMNDIPGKVDRVQTSISDVRADLMDEVKDSINEMNETITKLDSTDKSIKSSINSLAKEFEKNKIKMALKKDIKSMNERLNDFDQRVDRLIDYEKSLIEDFGEMERKHVTGKDEPIDSLKSTETEKITRKKPLRTPRVPKSRPPQIVTKSDLSFYGDQDFESKIKRLRNVLDKI